jgi:hypothetical protein
MVHALLSAMRGLTTPLFQGNRIIDAFYCVILIVAEAPPSVGYLRVGCASLFKKIGKNKVICSMILVNKESMLPVQALLVRIIRDSSFDNELEKALTTNVQVLPITKLLMASGKYPDIVAGAQ